ncbi:hypothetical protein HYV79_00745 [Candidatus Woesearchaeota archaeon]|nr:hypothetical protein [Candidatus Woesearchaeota archaeon]
MAVEVQPLLIMPSLVMGLAIGIYEAILLHRDVSVPTHRFGHMIHAIVFAIIAVFCTMNTGWLYSVIPDLEKIAYINNEWVLRAAIGFIALIKIHGVSAAIRGGGGAVGLKETWFHSFFISGLIVTAPLLWDNVIKNLAPEWMRR